MKNMPLSTLNVVQFPVRNRDTRSEPLVIHGKIIRSKFIRSSEAGDYAGTRAASWWIALMITFVVVIALVSAPTAAKSINGFIKSVWPPSQVQSILDYHYLGL